jgi:LysM repeat protein
MVLQRNKITAVLILIVMALTFLVQSVAAADTTYTVQPGDTLAAIARRFGTTIQALATANHIVNPDLIYVNQTLVVPNGSSDPTPVTVPVPSLPTPGTTYVVQRGDTLFSISLRFGVSVQAIAQASGLTNINLIYVGQTLTIPGSTAPAPIPTQPPAPATPIPATTPSPTTPAPAPSGVNQLPNHSFEDGWYNQNGIPELQLPIHWIFEWDEGTNPFDSAPWSDFVRPETRVLSAAYLPANEHPLYIYDGSHTVKIFKGNGAISFRLMTDVTLGPGTYVFRINVFPDMVSGYANGQKVFAADPNSGELRFIVGNGGSNWILPIFGQKNTLSHTFTVNTTQTIRVGVAMRGRYALANNGWFMDDWSLVKVGN